MGPRRWERISLTRHRLVQSEFTHPDLTVYLDKSPNSHFRELWKIRYYNGVTKQTYLDSQKAVSLAWAKKIAERKCIDPQLWLKLGLPKTPSN